MTDTSLNPGDTIHLDDETTIYYMERGESEWYTIQTVKPDGDYTATVRLDRETIREIAELTGFTVTEEDQ